MKGFRFALTEFRHTESALKTFAKKAVQRTLDDPIHLHRSLKELKEVPRTIAFEVASPDFVSLLRNSGNESVLRYIGVPLAHQDNLEACTSEVLLSLARNPELTHRTVELLSARQLTIDQLCSTLRFAPNSQELTIRLLESSDELQSFRAFIDLLTAFKNSPNPNPLLASRLVLEFNQLLLKEGTLTVQDLVDTVELLDISIVNPMYDICKAVTQLSIKQLGAMNAEQVVTVLTSVHRLSFNYYFAKEYTGFKVVLANIPRLECSLEQLCKIVNLLSRLNVKALGFPAERHLRGVIENKYKQASLTGLVESLETCLLWELDNGSLKERIIGQLSLSLGKCGAMSDDEKCALFKIIKVIAENQLETPPIFLQLALSTVPHCNLKAVLSCLSSCIVTQSPELTQAAMNRTIELVPSLEFDDLLEVIMYADKLDSTGKVTPVELINALAKRLLQIKNEWDFSTVSFIIHRFSFKSLNVEIHDAVCKLLIEADRPEITLPDLNRSLYYYKQGQSYVYPQNQFLNQFSIKGLCVTIYALLRSRLISKEVRKIVNSYLLCILESKYLLVNSKHITNLGLALSSRDNFDREMMTSFINAINTYGIMDYENGNNWKNLNSLQQITVNLKNIERSGEALPELVINGEKFS